MFSGKNNTEIAMLLVDKTQVQPGDTINYAAIFRKQSGTPTETLSVVWNGWNPNMPHINTKYEYSFGENSGTAGTSIGSGFWMRAGSVVVPIMGHRRYIDYGGDRHVCAVDRIPCPNLHLLLRVGPTQRQLLVSSSCDGWPAGWGTTWHRPVQLLSR